MHIIGILEQLSRKSANESGPTTNDLADVMSEVLAGSFGVKAMYTPTAGLDVSLAGITVTNSGVEGATPRSEPELVHK